MREVTGSIEKLSEEDINRIREIRSGLISSCFGQHDNETFLFAFLDYIHLLFQPTPEDDPLVFTIWINNRCKYSSFRDLYYTTKYPLDQNSLNPPTCAVRLSSNGLWLAIHRVKTLILFDLETNAVKTEEFGSSFQEQVLSTKDVELLLEKVWLLMFSEDPRLGTRLIDIPDFERLLGETISAERPEYPAPRVPQFGEDINYQSCILPMLDSFRGVLDEAFRELKRPLFPDHKPDLGNIFCVVRTVQFTSMRKSSFPYTAGLLLSNKQRADFKQWCITDCKKKTGECPLNLSPEANCLDQFEFPLVEGSRSAADVTFCSGIIDFGRKPGDGVWDCIDNTCPREHERELVEGCVYPKAANSQGQDPSLYYVPVHVNGIPWLVLFTFSPALTNEKGGHKRWQHNYTFYREATRKAVSYIRLKAEEEYLAQLISLAFGEKTSWHLAPDEILRKVNSLWDIASRVFPFPRFSLVESATALEGNSNKYFAPLPRIPGRTEEWGIQVEMDNPYFGGYQVTWGRVDQNRLVLSLQRMMTSQINSWANISNAESTRTAAYSAHLFKTPINKLSERLRRLPNDANKKSLLMVYQQLKNLSTFAMASIDRRRRTVLRQEMKRIPAQSFIDTINCELATILELLSDIETDSSVKAVVTALKNRKDLIRFGSTWETLCGEVIYHSVQLQSVFDLIFSNAIDAMVGTDHFLQIDCLDPTNREIILVVRNSDRASFDEVTIKSQRANSGRADQLGITNITQSCLAFDFTRPRWFSETNTSSYAVMGVQLVIGEYLPTMEKKL